MPEVSPSFRARNLLIPVTLPEYAFVDPISGLAIGVPQARYARTSVQTLASVPEIVLLLPRRVLALALPPDVSQPPAEVPYHLLDAVMVMVVRLFGVPCGARRRGRRSAVVALILLLYLLDMVKGMMVVLVAGLMVMAAPVERVVHGMMIVKGRAEVGRV